VPTSLLLLTVVCRHAARSIAKRNRSTMPPSYPSRGKEAVVALLDERFRRGCQSGHGDNNHSRLTEGPRCARPMPLTHKLSGGGAVRLECARPRAKSLRRVASM